MRMRACNLIVLLVSIVVPSFCMAINITVEPLKYQYSMNEPIAIEYTINNDSQYNVDFLIDYPDDMGISIGPGSGYKMKKNKLYLSGELEQVESIKPKESFKTTIFLKRFINISRVGKLEISYSIDLLYSLGKELIFNKKYIREGKFIIYVQKNQNISKLIANYYKIIKDNKNSYSNEALVAEEALLWADDQTAIPALELAAKKQIGSVSEIVTSIAKYIKHKNAIDSILRIALYSDSSTLKTIFDVFIAENINLPQQTIRLIIHNGSAEQIIPLLNYLLTNGNAEDIDIVKPLLKYPNKQIRNLSAEVIKIIQNKDL